MIRAIVVQVLGRVILATLWLINIFRPLKFVFLDGLRIGQLTMFPEIFLRSEAYKKFPNHKFIFFTEKSCNKALMKIIKRYLSVIESNWVFRSLSRIKDVKSCSLFYEINRSKEGKHYHIEYLKVEHQVPAIKLSERELAIGKGFLKKIGLSEKDWFVCFHNRDSAYLLKNVDGSKDWAYHDYRDSKIENYLEAAEYITSMGGFCIRIGKDVEESLPNNNNNPKIIDYASHHQDDLLDLFLISQAKFVIGSSCGLLQVASMFNTPVAFVNMIPLYVHGYSSRDLFIPKKLKFVRDRSPVPYSKIISDGAEFFETSEKYEDLGYFVEENSKVEILQITKEMLLYIEDKLVFDLDYKEKSKIFKDQFNEVHFCTQVDTKISPSFLNNHPELLL